MKGAKKATWPELRWSTLIRLGLLTAVCKTPTSNPSSSQRVTQVETPRPNVMKTARTALAFYVLRLQFSLSCIPWGWALYTPSADERKGLGSEWICVYMGV